VDTGSSRNSFVFVVCGERHAARLNVALKYLKHFSRSDIIVVKSRARQKLDCDQVIDCKVPRGFDNHRASIFLKTSLHRTLAGLPGRFCYLDSDVIAVNRDADAIFALPTRPVLFAQDHGNLSRFSRYAVNCGCKGEECEHLPRAIRKKFGASITEKHWNHWNGGVFAFDRDAAEFMETWHRYTLAAFDDPYWKTRDQGTLVATVWKLKLQKLATLPREFNFIVDRYQSIPQAKRKSARPGAMSVNDGYSLSDASPQKPRPSLIHFINGGVGTQGWKNWDDVELLLKQEKAAERKAAREIKASAAALKKTSAKRGLSRDNRVVHGLWIGSTLSKMELLTLKSFLHHGHEFHLWVYDRIETPLPEGVILEDANEILPRSRITRKAEVDPETGVGKGSVSPFSDLFRYKLLYEKGGYWVDMDVTCLKPLNFRAPYVFRAHRIGVVGNIMKCPPKSRLMKELYERVSPEINPHTEWLMANRALSELVKKHRLSRYIRADVWNQDSWKSIRPYAMEEEPLPAKWAAIHWLNEFWRTLKANDGVYQGRRMFDVVPDKDNPKPGSALAGLYAEYGLSPAKEAAHPPAWPRLTAPMNRPAARQPSTPQFFLPSYLNVLVTSMARGGAERIVLETVSGLQRRKSSGKLFVLFDSRSGYPLENLGSIRAYPLHAQKPQDRLHTVAAEVLASPEQLLFTHMIKADDLSHLWARGVKTVPVIHNTRESWQDAPASFNVPQVPFVVAVSDQVARQLREEGCSRRIVVIRHELQRWFTVEEQQENRKLIRDRHGIADRTLLIGMVGAFKAQRAYTRAIRALARLKQQQPAKLMILGGWDHEWGYGRQAYTATHRLAVELDVVADLLTPGSVADAERYYAAFDVFLNTSVHDGLSVSLLEAIQAGCPIVTADVGGNREVLPERAVLVKDPADIGAYVAGIEQVCSARSRVLVPKPPDHDLIPRLWCWMGRYGRSDLMGPLAERRGTLFLTDNLNIGGAQRSLVNLLCNMPEPSKSWLCVLDTVFGQGYLDQLQGKGVPVLSLRDAGDYHGRIERILSVIERLKVRNVCFWNVDPRIKLLLAKLFPPECLRLIDVSPGPFLFQEMDGAREFQRRIAFTAAEYWERLDHFVAKYAGGIPPGVAAGDPRLAVIPNGVPLPAAAGEVPRALPPGADSELVIGTACRILPGKRLEFLIDMMAELNRHLTGANLIVVGGVDPRHEDYWPALVERLRARHVANIHFVGPHHEVTPYLRLCRVLVMIADTPGCPNVSLEAMALGIPVVANAAGGTGEQVIDGENGFLVGGKDPKEMASRVRMLLTDRELRRRCGETARETAVRRFSMEAMVRRYLDLFGDPHPATRGSFRALVHTLISPTPTRNERSRHA